MNNYHHLFKLFADICRKHTSKEAVYEQKTQRTISFEELYQQALEHSKKLKNHGVKEKDRVIMGFRPSIEFIVNVFALFHMNAVPIFIDSGLPFKNLLNCIKGINAKAIIGSKKTFLVSKIFKKSFKDIELFLTPNLNLHKKQSPYSEKISISENDLAAIVFTSGSTGAAKGVLYTHKMFLTQIDILKSSYNINKNDIDMSLFPLFSLFALCMEVPTVILDIDFARLLKNNPKKILHCIKEKNVTLSFGSPTMWNKIADYCIQNKQSFHNLEKIIMAGCAIPHKLLKKIYQYKLLSGKEKIFITYGATESLPVTSIEGKEILSYSHEKSNLGHGTCIGKAISNDIDIQIIKISDDSSYEFETREILAPDMHGEIIISGDIVSPAYFNLGKKGKLFQGEKIWHRIGDIVYKDKNNYYWISSRKEDIIYHRNEILFTTECENIFNNHPAVYRSALIKIKEKPTILIEIYKKEKKYWAKIHKELLEIAQKNSKTKNIKNIQLHKKFPVDIRHNAKIKRDILTKELNNN